MDGSHFDILVRGMAHSRSRRGALRTLATGWLVAVGLAVEGRPVLGDRCKKAGKKCEKNGDCCRGLTCKGKKCACKAQGKACGNTCCTSGETCIDSGSAQQCCPAGQVCGGTCCANGEECLAEGPQQCCPATKVCGTECCGPHRTCVCPIPPDIPGVPPDPDPPCFCRCEDGWKEDASGACVCTTTLCGDECCETDKGEQCCGGPAADTCTNVLIDDHHCGKCGNVCKFDEVCLGGECRCPYGTTVCGLSCVDLAKDPDNCGSCGFACAHDHTCVEGRCRCRTNGQACEDHSQCCDDLESFAAGLCFEGVCRCCPWVPILGNWLCCEQVGDMAIYCDGDDNYAYDCCQPGRECDEYAAVYKNEFKCEPMFISPGVCNV